MLQRYEKGGEKGASVRALAPDFSRHWSRFSSLPRFPAFAGFSVAALFSDFVRFPPPAPPPAPPPVLPLIPPLVPPFVLRSPWLVFSLRSILLPPVRHRLARCVRPCCPISSSAACCPAPSGPFLICSVPRLLGARPLFPLRYVPSRSLFRLRCVRPLLSACLLCRPPLVRPASFPCPPAFLPCCCANLCALPGVPLLRVPAPLPRPVVRAPFGRGAP